FEVWSGVPIRRIGILYPESSWWYFVGTPVYAAAVFLWLVRHQPSVIHASDVEGMAGVALYRLVGGRARILFNIHDNFALRYSVPRWVRRVLSWCEATLGRAADVVLLPDEQRLKLLAPWTPRVTLIVPNSPPDPGVSPLTPARLVRLFAPGWLSWRRGYQSLGGLVMSRDDVELIICGSGSDEVVAFVRSLPRCEYHGYVSQKEALVIGRTCHLIAAFYDPAVEINRYASSNKVFDAMALGRPVITNDGIAIAEWVRTHGIGFVIPYGDTEALVGLVEELHSNPEVAAEIGRRARSLYEREFDWKALKTRLSRAFWPDTTAGA
ncbi:MAG: glycosyltransferase, partial [bacterium]